MRNERLTGNSERQLLLGIVAQIGIKLFTCPCRKRARATCRTSCRHSLQKTTAAATQHHGNNSNTMATTKHPDSSGGCPLCHLLSSQLVNQSTTILGEHWFLFPGTHNSVFEALSIASAPQQLSVSLPLRRGNTWC